MMSSDEYRDLKASIDDRFKWVDERFTRVDERFALIDRRFDEVDQRFDEVDRRFGEVDRRFDEVDRRFVLLEMNLREEIRTTAAETRRHFDVVAEDLKSTIRLIADGHAHHASVLDDHETRLQQLEQGRLRFDG